MKYFVVGGAGFIGSHLTRRLLRHGHGVTVYDNFSSGRSWHLSDVEAVPSLRIVRGNVCDLPSLSDAMKHHAAVFHLAANPDIAKAVTQPDIDFWEGTYLMQNVVEAMRLSGVRRIFYASGSGVYGDTGDQPVFENFSPLRPISTYGASKLACEAMVVAGKPYPPATALESELEPDAPDALEHLRSAGFLLICVTNQPDVARGKQTQDAVVAINDKLRSLLPLDDILVCYHDDADQCDCRKPSPGQLLQAARLREIDLTRSFMIGDRWRDIAAGNSAGCQTILIDRNYSEAWKGPMPDFRVSTLWEAANLILSGVIDD